MRIQTVLNHCYPLKSFVYTICEFQSAGDHCELTVTIEPRKNGLVLCSGCDKPRKVYDHLNDRQFSFVPFWNIPVLFKYRIRRVDCPECGVKVEKLPWADGKSRTTKAYQIFLAGWAKKLSWSDVARSFDSSWDTVFRSVKMVVEYGLKHRDLNGVTAIGVDEIQYAKGHQYLTLVYQIDSGTRRLLYVGKNRTCKTLLRFFHEFGKERTALLKFICSDMWRPYLKVIRKKAPLALNILDRFHIVKKINEAVNKVRVEEVKKLRSEGYDEDVLKIQNTAF